MFGKDGNKGGEKSGGYTTSSSVINPVKNKIQSSSVNSKTIKATPVENSGGYTTDGSIIGLKSSTPLSTILSTPPTSLSTPLPRKKPNPVDKTTGWEKLGAYYIDHYLVAEPTSFKVQKNPLFTKLEDIERFESKLAAASLGATMSKLSSFSMDKLLTVDNFFYTHHEIFKHAFPQIAGVVRPISISRSDISFVDSSKILPTLNTIFDLMKKDPCFDPANKGKIPEDEFMTKFAVFDMMIYLTHPAVNGNTRAKDTLLSAVAKKMGFELELNYDFPVSKKYQHASVSDFAMEQLSDIGMDKLFSIIKTNDWAELKKAVSPYLNFIKENGILHKEGEKEIKKPSPTFSVGTKLQNFTSKYDDLIGKEGASEAKFRVLKTKDFSIRTLSPSEAKIHSNLREKYGIDESKKLVDRVKDSSTGSPTQSHYKRIIEGYDLTASPSVPHRRGIE